MTTIRSYLFGRMEGKRHETLPFTRWDILLSVVLGIALMAAIAYSVEAQGWSRKRGLLVAGVCMAVICAAQNRKVVLGCAFSLVALRMGIGALTGPHSMILLGGTLLMGIAAWLLLHDLE